MHREISRGLSIRVNNQWNRGQEQQIANIPESYRQTNLQVGEKNGEDGQQLYLVRLLLADEPVVIARTIHRRTTL